MTRHCRWPLANTDLTSRTLLVSKILPVDKEEGQLGAHLGRWAVPAGWLTHCRVVSTSTIATGLAQGLLHTRHRRRNQKCVVPKP